VNIPPNPAGYSAVPLSEYRASHPKAGQLAAVPGVIAELTGSSTYAAAFGPAAPDAGVFVQVLGNALGWTELRIAIETFLLYVKLQEAVAWKSGLTQIEQAKAIYDVVVARTPNVAVQFPALGQKAAASRKKAKAAKAATTATAAAASVVSPAAPVANAATGQGGGVAH
jgi:hypothetical protein